MARKITDKPNAIGVSGTYPYGDVKDNSGSGDGMPVNRLVYSDFHQFFARMADLAGIVLNSLPDNAVNGWQFVTALQTLIANAVAGEASIRSAADTNLTNTKVAKAGDSMTGALAMGTNKITGLGTPTNAADATTKTYVDTADATEISIRSAADTALDNAKVNRSGDVVSGTLEIDGGIRTKNSGVFFKMAVIDLGDWNMDSTPNIAVVLPVNVEKVHSYGVAIYGDGNVGKYSMGLIAVATNSELYLLTEGYGSNSVAIERRNAGIFDNTNFDQTSFNRGKLFIIHEV